MEKISGVVSILHQAGMKICKEKRQKFGLMQKLATRGHTGFKTFGFKNSKHTLQLFFKFRKTIDNKWLGY